MFVLIPLFALMLQLVYRNRRLVYGEHLSVCAASAHLLGYRDCGAGGVARRGACRGRCDVVLRDPDLCAACDAARVAGGAGGPRCARPLLSMGYWVLMLLMIVVVTGLALVRKNVRCDGGARGRARGRNQREGRCRGSAL